MILISSGLLAEDERVFSKARNKRLERQCFLVSASTDKSWSSFILYGWKTDWGQKDNDITERGHVLITSRLRSSAGHLKVQFSSSFGVLKKKNPCQLLGFRLFQIRNFRVSSFSSKCVRQSICIKVPYIKRTICDLCCTAHFCEFKLHEINAKRCIVFNLTLVLRITVIKNVQTL